MVIHSSILAWEIPWTEEPGGPVHGVARVGHSPSIGPSIHHRVIRVFVSKRAGSFQSAPWPGGAEASSQNLMSALHPRQSPSRLLTKALGCGSSQASWSSSHICLRTQHTSWTSLNVDSEMWPFGRIHVSTSGKASVGIEGLCREPRNQLDF